MKRQNSFLRQSAAADVAFQKLVDDLGPLDMRPAGVVHVQDDSVVCEFDLCNYINYIGHFLGQIDDLFIPRHPRSEEHMTLPVFECGIPNTETGWAAWTPTEKDGPNVYVDNRAPGVLRLTSSTAERVDGTGDVDLSDLPSELPVTVDPDGAVCLPPKPDDLELDNWTERASAIVSFAIVHYRSWQAWATKHKVGQTTGTLTEQEARDIQQMRGRMHRRGG